MKPLVYLASPYSSEDEAYQDWRAEKATEAFARLCREGVLVYSPIASCHHVAKSHKMPGDWQFWQDLDRRMIDAADSVLVLQLPGWGESVGVGEEIAHASKTGKPVAYLDPVTWTVTP